jgi:hypothetical protein
VPLYLRAPNEKDITRILAHNVARRFVMLLEASTACNGDGIIIHSLVIGCTKLIIECVVCGSSRHNRACSLVLKVVVDL